MLYSKKSLFVFSIVALSTVAVAGFFIRQKILNDWEIAKFNALLKQIVDLEIEIQKDEKDLENYEKLTTNKEEQIQKIEKDIEKLEESIDKNSKKFLELNSRNISNQQAKGLVNVSNKYKTSKEKIGDDTESSNWKALFSVYEKILLNYIHNKQNILKQMKKYENLKKTETMQKENLNKEKAENKKLLSELKNLTDELNENIKNKKSALITLKKSKERKRKRERERAVIKYFVNKIFNWHFLKNLQQFLVFLLL